MVRIGRTEVNTPADGGIVSPANGQIGAVATAAGEPMFRIIAKGEIELDAEVPEQRLLRTEAGQTCESSFCRTEHRSAAGFVWSRRKSIARPGSAACGFRSATKSRLRIGAFARGTIEIAPRAVGRRVPSSAMIYGEASDEACSCRRQWDR